MSGTRRGSVVRRTATVVATGALLAAIVAGPVVAQDTGTGTDDEGNTVAVGAPPPPPPPPPPPTTIVAVGQPPVPPPPPTTTIVAVGQPPVPSTTVVASQPATLVNRPIVERPAAVSLVGDTARVVAAQIERISARL